MKKIARGFGLIEIMVALVLGLVVSLGVVQIFIAARGTYLSQNTSAQMQEDARFVLSKMVQEIRLAGMYGCLTFTTPPTGGAIARPAAFDNPILWDNANSTLTLITADIGSSGASPTWFIVSDCQSSSQLYTALPTLAAGQTAFPLRQLTYVRTGSEMTVKLGSAQPQALLSNISSFDVSFGMATNPMTYVSTVTAATAADIRSVRISLTLSDPKGQVKNQTYKVVAAVRNRF